MRPQRQGSSWLYLAMVALVACNLMPALSQTWPFPWPEDRIARYTARRTSSSLVIDGRLDEPVWHTVERSPRVADLISGRPGIHDTRAAVLWDDTYLYVGYWVEEPFVEATLTERDAPIYQNKHRLLELGYARVDVRSSRRRNDQRQQGPRPRLDR